MYYTLIISVVSIILVLVLSYIFIKSGNDIFTPNKKKIDFEIFGSTLQFKSTSFSGLYEIEIPKGLKIKDTDVIHISYNFDRGYLTNIREIYINDNLKIKEDDIQKNSLKIILN